jgi:gluconolactonase
MSRLSAKHTKNTKDDQKMNLKKTTLSVFCLMAVALSSCAKKSEQPSSTNGMDKLPIPANAVWEKVVDGMNFPEGPAWDGQNTLYASNCYGGWVTRLASGKADTFLVANKSPFTFQQTNGLIFHDGFLYACDFGAGAILRFSTDGTAEIYAKDYHGAAFNRPNDLRFDAEGNLYFTDPKTYSREVLDGRVFRIGAQDKSVTLLAESLGFPNGMAISADGTVLYVCESAFERILRFTIGEDGNLTNREIFVTLPGGDPDGIDLDNAGNLFVAHFGSGTVYVIAPDGSIKQKISTPGKKPTNLEFAGDELKTLFLTEVETNALYKLNVEMAGMKNF